MGTRNNAQRARAQADRSTSKLLIEARELKRRQDRAGSTRVLERAAVANLREAVRLILLVIAEDEERVARIRRKQTGYQRTTFDDGPSPSVKAASGGAVSPR
jgi:transcription termination factor Rho